MKDLVNHLSPSQSIKPAAHNASVNGSGVDLQDHMGACVVVNAGTVTDGTHTPKLEESDDNSTWTEVVVDDLEGTFAAIASDTVQKVGYKGYKRYVRAVSTVAGATTGGVYSIDIILGRPKAFPAA